MGIPITEDNPLGDAEHYRLRLLATIRKNLVLQRTLEKLAMEFSIPNKTIRTIQQEAEKEILFQRKP